MQSCIGFHLPPQGYDLESYVHDYFTVDRLKVAYERIVYPMTDKGKWPPVDPGFKIHPPVIRRQPGRPRKQRIKGSEEPRARKRYKCKRCDQLGRHWPNCKHCQSGGGSNDPTSPKPPPAKKTSKKYSTGSFRLEQPRPTTPRAKRLSLYSYSTVKLVFVRIWLSASCELLSFVCELLSIVLHNL